MKLLLTSGGVTNPSILTALVDLLPKPLAECDALCIPTAGWGHPGPRRPVLTQEFVAGTGGTPMAELGWRSVGVLELTAVPSIGDPDALRRWVEAVDVLLVDGGDARYLAHWVRESGLADLLARYPEKVWVGLSAGSMVLTPRIGADFVEWQPPGATTVDDATLGVVDFSIFPHLDHPDMEENTMAAAEQWAAGLDHPAYAIDEATAIRVVDGAVDVVSEGQWRQLPTGAAARPAGT